MSWGLLDSETVMATSTYLASQYITTYNVAINNQWKGEDIAVAIAIFCSETGTELVYCYKIVIKKSLLVRQSHEQKGRSQHCLTHSQLCPEASLPGF